MADNNVPSFRIMTLNVGGPGNVDARRGLIRGFQTQLQQCSVIFAQECNGEDRKNLMRILGRRDYQISPEKGNIDIAIIWQSEMFYDVKVIDDEKINGIINDKELFQQMIDEDYDINNRVKVIRAELLPNRRVVYFASWHGPHNLDVDKPGELVPLKQETATDLIQLMKSISGRQPFIIGGDFNLLADEYPVDIDGVEVHNRTPNRMIPHDIDYFVLGNRGVFDVQNVTRLTLKNRRILDHQPVQATFLKL